MSCCFKLCTQNLVVAALFYFVFLQDIFDSTALCQNCRQKSLSALDWLFALFVWPFGA